MTLGFFFPCSNGLLDNGVESITCTPDAQAGGLSGDSAIEIVEMIKEIPHCAWTEIHDTIVCLGLEEPGHKHTKDIVSRMRVIARAVYANKKGRVRILPALPVCHCLNASR
jgi:hypothetical protein